MRLRLRPSFLNVETRGVDSVGKGTLDMFDVRVIVEGVLTDCSGGKTNRVCDGVGAGAVVDEEERRDDADGTEDADVDGIRRGGGTWRNGFGFDFGFCSTSGDLAPTGDGGTGGRRGGGLRFLNLLGGADKLNDCFAAGAEGGGGSDPNVVLLWRADGGGRNPKDCLVAGAVGGGRAVVGVKTLCRGREATRASSSVVSVLGVPLLLSAGISSILSILSSSSSSRSSLRTLRLVKLLATEPARLRPPWPKRLFHALPIPIPDPEVPVEAVVDCWEPFRATMRCSISRSSARASRMSSKLSRSSSSGEASSSSCLRRPHSASSASCEDRSEGVGDRLPPPSERSYSRS